MEDRRVEVPLAESELRIVMKCLRATESCEIIPRLEREALVCALIARFNRSQKAA